MQYRNHFTVVAIRLDGSHHTIEFSNKADIRKKITQLANPRGTLYVINDAGKREIKKPFLRFYAFDSEGFFVQYDIDGKPFLGKGKK